METYNGLRARLRAFVRAYVETGRGTEAVKALKSKNKHPACLASKLLARPTVRKAVEEFELSMQNEVRHRVYRALRRLELLAEFDPRELVDDHGAPKPLKDLPDDVALALQGVEVEELFEGRGESRERIGNLHKYKLASKIEALKLIMQYQRVLVHKHEHTGANGGPIQTQQVDELTDEQLETIARAGRAAAPESSAGED